MSKIDAGANSVKHDSHDFCKGVYSGHAADDDIRCAAYRPSCFFQLYESRDGRLLVFQDKDGHLSAVSAARLC